MKIFFLFFFWGKASEENEERREVNGSAVLWERAATEINIIRSTREMMRQGVGGGIWYSWTATIVLANNPYTPVDERFFTVEEKDSDMRETHEGNWVFQFCTVKTVTIAVTTKLKVSAKSENAAVTSWLWQCRCGLAGLVSWFSEHLDFVEQFSNTHGIFFYYFLSRWKRGWKNKTKIWLNFFQIHFTVSWKSNKNNGAVFVTRKGKRKTADRRGCTLWKERVTWEITPASLSPDRLLGAACCKDAELEGYWPPFLYVNNIHFLITLARTIVSVTERCDLLGKSSNWTPCLRNLRWGKETCLWLYEAKIWRETCLNVHLRDSLPRMLQVEQRIVNIKHLSMTKL